MNRLAYFIVLLAAAMLVLSGCSSVMRPPSATAFMSSYEKDYAVVNMSLALYGGDLDNDSVYYDNHTDQFDDHSEWVFDLTETIFWNKGFFSIGLGGQTVTPFGFCLSVCGPFCMEFYLFSCEYWKLFE